MISQTKNEKRHPQNLELIQITRKVIPRAFSLLLSAQLICSGLAFSAVASLNVSASAADGDAAAPSWNETKNDSMSAIGSGVAQSDLKPEIKSEFEAHTQPAKTENFAEVKPEVKVEIKAETKAEPKIDSTKAAKAETKSEAKSELKAETKAETKAEIKAEVSESKTEAVVAPAAAVVETKTSTSVVSADNVNSTVKSIAEIAPVSGSNADSAIIVPGATTTTSSATSVTSTTMAPGAASQTSSTSSTSSELVKTDDTLVVDSDKNAEEQSKAAAHTINANVTNISGTTEVIDSTKSVNVITGSDHAGLEAGSILSPDGKSLFGNESSAPKVGEGALTTVDSLSDDKMIELGATVVETGVNKDEVTADGEPLIVDSDQVSEVEESVKYENLPTDEGKTRIRTGARFPVVVTSQISSKNAHKGDGLEARLKYDLKIGDRLVAKKGSAVQGHINYALPARSVMHSLISSNRWYRNSGCLGVEFDEIVTDKGEHLPLVAAPAKNALIVKNKAEGRVLGVNHLGQIAGPWEQQLKYKAIRIGLNAAMAPAGVFSFGAMPVALGLIGAANPSFAFMKPVGTNVRHRRIKGFAWGFLSGLPGSWIIEDTVTKGNEAIIKPGDEFLVEFHQEFTGEPASEATMMPNANAKVHGDVRTSKKKAK